MKPAHLPQQRGHDLWRGPAQTVEACRCSSRFPKAYIWSRRRLQSKLLSPQPKAAFFHRSYTLCGKRPFCTWRFAYLPPHSASSNFKVVRPPVKPVNTASQQLVEGRDFYLWLSETQSGATFEACQSTGPRGKAYCPQIDPTPLVLFI